MACIGCNIDKLSNEFPSFRLCDECDHPSTLICLRCIVKHVEGHETCPYPGCNLPVKKSSREVQLCNAILDKQFKEYESANTPLVEMTGGSKIVNITGLTGESTTIPFNPSMTVDQLKTQIQTKLKHPRSKQKLIYEGTEMNVTNTNGDYMTLSNYGVKENSTVCLVICLLSIPEHLDEVIFDLYWGYPGWRRDYLDASCLIFSGASHNGTVDYDTKYSLPGVIRHSGDVLNDKKRIGHHTINVSLKRIPSNVSHLFFTLSAYNAPTIAHFPNPSLKFYDASKPGKDLCKTTFRHARNSQAVIMCFVCRSAQGNWEIFESGQLSAGNAKRYGPIINTIRQLISKGY